MNDYVPCVHAVPAAEPAPAAAAKATPAKPDWITATLNLHVCDLMSARTQKMDQHLIRNDAAFFIILCRVYIYVCIHMPIHSCPYWQPGGGDEEDEAPDTSGTQVDGLTVIRMCHGVYV